MIDCPRTIVQQFLRGSQMMIDDRRWTLPLGIMIDCPGTLMQRILRRRQTMLDVRRPTYDGRFTDGLPPNASTHRPTPASSTIRRQGRICGWRPPPCRRWCRRCGTSSLSQNERSSPRGTPLDVCSTRACPKAAWPMNDGDSPQERSHRRQMLGVSSQESMHARRWSGELRQHVLRRVTGVTERAAELLEVLSARNPKRCLLDMCACSKSG